MPEDPNLLFSNEEIDAAVQTTDAFLNKLEENKEARDTLQQEQIAEETQAKAEVSDPRDAEKWGLKAYAKEAQSILSGGLQDTASSITTFPERTIDAVSGEMARERKTDEGYRPDWDPFVDEENPIVTKTWWGKLARGTVHFGSMAAAIYGVAQTAPVTLPAWLIGATSLSLKRAAVVGAATDLISKESDGHNALGALRNSFGFIDTPLTTKDTDHPVMMKLKNILEGMGIGVVFDSVLLAVRGNAPRVAEQIKFRNDNIKNNDLALALKKLDAKQKIYAAEAEDIRLNNAVEPDVMNQGITDPWQGAYTSEQPVYEALQTLRRTRTWEGAEGSVGRVGTPVQLERIAREGDMSEDTAESILRNLIGDQRYQQELAAVRGNRQALIEVWGDSLEAYQRITLGRNPADLTPDEFLAELYQSKATYDITNAKGEVIDTIETFTAKNVVTADLIVGSLLHQIRDYGIAGRELADIADLRDIDGPAARIVDNIMALLRETKKARIMKSADFRNLGAGKQRPALEKILTQEMEDTKDAIISILKIAKEDESPEIMNALFELFSSMRTVNNIDDFDNWAKKMIKGGSMDPRQPNRTGVLIQELGKMYVHSILSGVKTSMRAIMGTSTATFMRPASQVVGATMTGDRATQRASLSAMNAMIQAIPESFELFRTRLNSYWSGDMSSVKTRFYDYAQDDANWELLRRYYEDSGRASLGDRALFAMANMARQANNSNLLTYSTKLMAATDDSFAYILGRARMREKAMRRIMDLETKGYDIPEITPEFMRAYENDFHSQVWDAQGNLTDEATKWARKEVTLTADLKGFAKKLEDAFAATPWSKPFFLFARTGVNGLTLTAKHTPGFNFLVKEFNDIARATPDNLAAVAEYGIKTSEDLANAKALQNGRLAIGSAVTFMAGQAFLNGNLTGNGPVDRQKRQAWIDAGYRPRQIKLGGVWVGYDSVEPFNLIFSTIGDIGDYSLLMGDEWTEQQFQKVALVIAQSVSSKSYFAGIQQMVDMVAGRPGQQNRILGGILNNQVPLAGLRNDLGKLFNPYMKEINSGVVQSVRNRNLISEYLTGEPLPTKYDLLNGRPIRDYDFNTRAYNTFSPISLNLDYSPGRKLIFDSGYDLRMSTFMSPDGVDLSEHPRLRSMFQKAIGDQKIEAKLNKLAENPKILESLDTMEADRNAGDRGKYDAMDYYHNMQIDRIFQLARRTAWAQIMNDPRIQQLKKEALLRKQAKYRKKEQTRDILSIYR